jgi:predicted RNA-binding protein YlxR (DUF448 family)
VAQGRADQERPPELGAARRRLCIATRLVRPVASMIRFVAAPDGAVVPDLERKLPGRGVWVTARRAMVAQAAGRGAFARGLKAKVQTPGDLPDKLEGLLRRSALDALSGAGKAGLVLPELAAARAALAERRVVALLRPRDAAADHRLEPVPWSGDGDRVEIVEAFTTAQLDLALGRLNVVNAALLTGRASETFLERWRILESFQADEPDEPRVRPHETALESGS